MNCPGCGKTLEFDFRYCPQCGRSVDGLKTFEKILDHSFARLSRDEAHFSVERLTELDENLRLLENELDDLAETGQRLRIHRR